MNHAGKVTIYYFKAVIWSESLTYSKLLFIDTFWITKFLKFKSLKIKFVIYNESQENRNYVNLDNIEFKKLSTTYTELHLDIGLCAIQSNLNKGNWNISKETITIPNQPSVFF